VAGVAELPFWQTTPLADMTREQWESLCDGCGRCCLRKLGNEETGEVHYTDVACRLLDPHACRCTDYAQRWDTVPDCIELSTEVLPAMPWMPPTCACRLLAEGKPLAWWHHLVSGSRDTVHQAGISVRGWARPEEGLDLKDYRLIT
jgi:uncharacterized cysteine cluster protein YcgN (CxxCxxCC family)